MGYLNTPLEARTRETHALQALEQARAALERDCPPLPSWDAMLAGTQPPLPPRARENDDADPGEWEHGWQFYTSSALHSSSYAHMLQHANRPDQARLRSCRGRNNSRWLTAIPSTEALKLSNPVHQCLLRRRLGLPIYADAECCEGRHCRAPVDPWGHHRSACTRTGRIHGRHAAACQPWRQVFNEAGYRVRAERLLRDTHLVSRPADRRRMDIVAAPGALAVGARRGVPLFGDVTVVSVHTRAGNPRVSAATHDGAALQHAITTKRRTYADVHASPQACLLVLGCEVYGRWSDDAVKIVREMAALKAQQAPRRLRNCARHAWSNRWWALIGVGVQRAIAEALLRHAGFDLQDNAPLQPPPPLADLLLDT